MDLTFTPEERAFRCEARDFLDRALPDDLRRKMIERRHLDKGDIVRCSTPKPSWGARM